MDSSIIILETPTATGGSSHLEHGGGIPTNTAPLLTTIDFKVDNDRPISTPLPPIRPSDLDLDAKHLQTDIIRIILQYLNDTGYHASKMVLLDEAAVKRHQRELHIHLIKRLKRAILEGDWADVDACCTHSTLIIKTHQKAFLYAVYKQQFLEYIHNHELTKAFTHLNKRLKPLEHLQPVGGEFRELCYLLTAKSVSEAPAFKNWEGIAASRERLVEKFQTMLDVEDLGGDGMTQGNVFLPPDRLITLLKQAVAYQMTSPKYHSNLTPKVKTLLEDYEFPVIPNTCKTTLIGHMGNVKTAIFSGPEGDHVISGGGDNTVRVWDTQTGACQSILHGHTSRIWSVASWNEGEFIASGSGDSTIKIWDWKKSHCLQTILCGGHGDVYSVAYHPTGTHLVSGGYDKQLKLFDLHKGVIVKTFSGHALSISKAIFTPLGNLIISASKDMTIKFWDILSGLCIKTISSHLGEVSCIDVNSSGNLLLSCSKDNSNRLWDIRMLRPLQRFKSHQNTSKNFIGAGFACNDALISGGSEDGFVYLWDVTSGKVVERLRGHLGTVYTCTWNKRRSLALSCSNDGMVKTWGV